MAYFDFSTLSSSDFEELVCDLLNAQEKESNSGIVFKTFKDGKDKGIDFRHSTEGNDNAIVGQAKHYYRTGYTGLKSALSQESTKLGRLSPGRYIVATSVDLSVSNVDEIKKLLAPYIKSSDDIYGAKDLNRLLENYPDLLKRHFKLWFSSSSVLEKLLRYEIDGRTTDFVESELKRKVRLYVETSSLAKAKQVLSKNKFIIITGGPGVGKTTTAELIVYDLMQDGYELVYIHEDISDIERKLTEDDKKQLFYFDDFLGHNSVEMTKAKGSESTLLRILRRIIRANNKRFILTTRTFILNAAVSESERMRQFNFNTAQSIVELTEYTNDIKNKLLENHIDESELNDELASVLDDKEVRAFIINHKNFAPRSIEFITMNSTVLGFSKEQYHNFIKHNFNSPDEIWRHAYEQQIDDNERMLLNTMVTFFDGCYLRQLENAFNARLDYEVTHNNFKRPLNAFNSSFRKLEGGFFKEMNGYTGYFQLINPSLADFLLGYLKEDKSEAIRMAEAAFYLRQLTNRFFPIGQRVNQEATKHMTGRLHERLLSGDGFFIKADTADSDRLTLAILVHTYVSIHEAQPLVLNLLEEISDWGFVELDHDMPFFLEQFLDGVQSRPIVEKIAELGKKIFPALLLATNDLDDILKILKISLDKFDMEASTLFTDEEAAVLNERVTSLLDELIETDIEELMEISHADSFVEEKEQNIQNIKEYLTKFGIKANPDFNRFSQHDWWRIGLDNYFSEQMQKDD